MATRTVVQTIDDIDHEPIPDGAARRFSCNIDGTDYELDVSDSNLDLIRNALAPFLGDLPAKPRRRTRKRAAPRTRNGDDLTADERATIRAWGLKQGLMTAGRGRLPRHVVDAYHDEQAG